MFSPMATPHQRSMVSREEMDNLGEVRLPKTSELVAGKLRRLILRGKLSEGESLPAEAELAAQLKVSRPAIREALRILESESLVVVRRGRNGGGRVKAPSVQVAAHYTGLLLQARNALLDDVLATRLLIEPEAVRLLAEKGNPDSVEELRNIVLEEAMAVDNSASFVKLTALFHRALARLCLSPTIEILVAVLAEIVVAHLESVSSERPIPSDAAKVAVRAHTKLVDLIADRATDEAVEFWRQHLMAVGEGMLFAMGSRNVLDVLGSE
jgi:GntR family transcriptional regulator, transcriptional repressor for pyruvate dehydrogenase complex